MRTLFTRPSVRRSTLSTLVVAILGATGYVALGLRSDQDEGHPMSAVELEKAQESFPETPLALAVDQSVVPQRATIASLPGEKLRPVGRINDAGGVPMDLVLGEVVVTYSDPADLDAFVAAVDGEVVDRFDDDGEEVRDALVRFGDLEDDASEVAAAMTAIEPDLAGDWTVSGDDVLSVFHAVAIAHELGLVAMPNTLHESTGILDGSTTDGTSSNYGDDAFTYPYIASGTAQDIGLDRAWRLLADTDNLGKVVRIMVHDQGFSLNQDSPDARWIEDAQWGVAAPTAWGAVWHGAMVVNAALGKVDNGFGGAGPAGPTYAQLVAVGDAGSSWSTIRRLVDLVDEYRPQILNMSWSGDKTTTRLAHQDFFERKFKKIEQMGTLAFASAGNDSRNIDWKACGGCIERRLVLPCEAHHVRCVGGMGDDTTARAVGGCGNAAGSNYGTRTGGRSVEIWGPYFVSGQRTNSGNPSRFCGTSFASPFVAGVAGLVHAADPDLGPKGIWDVIKQTAHDGGIGTEVSGHQRRIDAAHAVERALGGIFLPPRLEIVSPRHQDEYTMGDFVSFDAEATDHQGRTLTVLWESDRDGVLAETKIGTGTDKLSGGIHFITATASDNLGDTVKKMVMITVENQPTTVQILSPNGGEDTWFGTPIQLLGVAEDDDLLGYEVPAEDLTWSVFRQETPQQVLFTGQGNSVEVPKNTLGPGIYVAQLAADVDGFKTVARSMFFVKVPATGAVPNAVIDTPDDLQGFGFSSGNAKVIHFEGHASDAEDGALSGTRLRWTAVHTDEFGNKTVKVLCTGSDVPTKQDPPKNPGLWLEGNGGVQPPSPTFKATVDCSSFDAELGLNGEIGAADWKITLEAFDGSGGPAGTDKVLITVNWAVA